MHLQNEEQRKDRAKKNGKKKKVKWKSGRRKNAKQSKREKVREKEERERNMRDLYIAACAKKEEAGGIYHYKMDDAGECSFCEKTALDQPMYLAIQNGRMYVLLRDAFGGDESGMMSFAIGEDGSLHSPSEILSTQGKVACHIWVEGEEILAVNYVSGSFIKYPGRLVTHEGKGIHPLRQEGPHTHYICVTPDKKYICVTDLGLDKIFFYDRDQNEAFSIAMPQGHGPRHLIFSRDGRYLYCVNELKSTVSVIAYDGEHSGLLHTYNALPEDFRGENLAAAIRIRGDELYVSNRGHDSIAVFGIKGDELALKGFFPVGKEPRDFHIAGDLLISADMGDNRVTFYKITENGMERQTAALENIPVPLCVVYQ